MGGGGGIFWEEKRESQFHFLYTVFIIIIIRPLFQEEEAAPKFPHAKAHQLDVEIFLREGTRGAMKKREDLLKLCEETVSRFFVRHCSHQYFFLFLLREAGKKETT